MENFAAGRAARQVAGGCSSQSTREPSPACRASSTSSARRAAAPHSNSALAAAAIRRKAGPTLPARCGRNGLPFAPTAAAAVGRRRAAPLAASPSSASAAAGGDDSNDGNATGEAASPSASPSAAAAGAEPAAAGGRYSHLAAGARLADDCDALDLAAVAEIEARRGGAAADLGALLGLDGDADGGFGDSIGCSAGDNSDVPEVLVLSGGPSRGSGRSSGDGGGAAAAAALPVVAPSIGSGADGDGDDGVPRFTEADLWGEVGDEVPAYWDVESVALGGGGSDGDSGGDNAGPVLPPGPDTFTIVSKPGEGDTVLVSADTDGLLGSSLSNDMDDDDDDDALVDMYDGDAATYRSPGTSSSGSYLEEGSSSSSSSSSSAGPPGSADAGAAAAAATTATVAATAPPAPFSSLSSDDDDDDEAYHGYSDSDDGAPSVAGNAAQADGAAAAAAGGDVDGDEADAQRVAALAVAAAFAARQQEGERGGARAAAGSLEPLVFNVGGTSSSSSGSSGESAGIGVGGGRGRAVVAAAGSLADEASPYSSSSRPGSDAGSFGGRAGARGDNGGAYSPQQRSNDGPRNDRRGYSDNQGQQQQRGGGEYRQRGDYQQRERGDYQQRERGDYQQQQRGEPRERLPMASDFNVAVTSWDEEGSPTPGYWVGRLQEMGVLDAQGNPAKGTTAARRSGDTLRVVVNKMLTLGTSWGMVLDMVRDLGPLFDGVNVSTAAHRVAKMARAHKANPEHVRSSPNFGRLLQLIKSTLPQFRPRQLANTSWALATLGHPDVSLLQDITCRCLDKGAWAFKEQELTNVMWACGTLGLRDEQLLRAFSAEMLARGVVAFTEQALSNTVWAHACLDYCNEPFLRAAASEVFARLNSCPSQAVANTLWGVGSLGATGALEAAQLEDLCERLKPRLWEFKEQELSNVLLAMAKLDFVHEPFLQAFEYEAGKPRRLSTFVPQALSNMLWSFATLRYLPGSFIDRLGTEIVAKLHMFKDQELANTVWAYAKLGYHPGAVFDRIVGDIEDKLDALGAQACSNIIWGLAVLQAPGRAYPVFPALVDRFVALGIETMDPKQIHQLFQALLLTQLEYNNATGDPSSPSASTGTDNGADGGSSSSSPQQQQQQQQPALFHIPQALREEAFRMWQATALEVQHSAFHADVSQALDALRLPHVNEYLTEGGLFSVDIALVGGNKKVALEVDGPFHFTVNTLQPLGSSLLRYRLLRALGWTVVSVPFYEWYELGSDKRNKLEYLAKKLSRSDPPPGLEEGGMMGSAPAASPRAPPTKFAAAAAAAAARASGAGRGGSGSGIGGVSPAPTQQYQQQQYQQRDRGDQSPGPGRGRGSSPYSGGNGEEGRGWDQRSSGTGAGTSGRSRLPQGGEKPPDQPQRRNPMAQRRPGAGQSPLGKAMGGRGPRQQQSPPSPGRARRQRPPQQQAQQEEGFEGTGEPRAQGAAAIDIISGLRVGGGVGSAQQQQQQQQQQGERLPTPQRQRAAAAALAQGALRPQQGALPAPSAPPPQQLTAGRMPVAAIPQDSGASSSRNGGSGATAAPAPAAPAAASPGTSSSSGGSSSGGSGGRGKRAAELGGMTVVELRPMCKALGLPVSGKKAELVQRIVDHEFGQ